MHILVKNDIQINNPTQQVKDWCEENLVIDNPDYYKLKRLGKWTGNTPKEICLYSVDGNIIIIPFGCFGQLWRLVGNSAIWQNLIKPISRIVDYQSRIEPYPYQEKAITKAVNHKNGILVMPCGSGKTQCGLEIISRIGGKALWLTHTSDLLNQSKKRAQSVLGYTEFGTITEGKVNIGNGITFATVQTMSKIDLQRFQSAWDIIIVDECQHCAGSPTRVTQFYKVVNSLKARYKIGLTATPYRADGLDQAMFAILGDIIYEVPREEVSHTTCPIEVTQIETGWFPEDDVCGGDGTIDFSKVVNSLTNDEKRTDLVVSYVNMLDSCIVLANRVAFLVKLRDRYIGKGILLSGIGASKQAKEIRKEALRKLNNGEIDCIFATYQLAKEGLDVPNLRYVVLATPEKDETTVVQSVGRVGRKAEGKDKGRVLDFVDDFPMHKTWAKKREKYYKKIDAKVIKAKGREPL